jgi:hypothetical protein
MWVGGVQKVEENLTCKCRRITKRNKNSYSEGGEGYGFRIRISPELLCHSSICLRCQCLSLLTVLLEVARCAGQARDRSDDVDNERGAAGHVLVRAEAPAGVSPSGSPTLSVSTYRFTRASSEDASSAKQILWRNQVCLPWSSSGRLVLVSLLTLPCFARAATPSVSTSVFG